MLKPLKIMLAAVLITAQSALWAASNFVEIETNMGTMTLELNQDKAPITVANFLAYVDNGFYDGLIFHRVIPNFVIQAGGFDKGFSAQATLPPISNEASNGLSNVRGSISMARTSDPNSATSQFFLNLINNNHLDKNATSAGYAVFGQLTGGLDVMDKIASVSTGSVVANGLTYSGVPLNPVIISSIRRKQAHLAFSANQSQYQAGDNLSISLKEQDIVRSDVLDLWVALQMPNGEFLYLKDNNGASEFSALPVAYKNNVESSQTQFEVLNMNLPAGLEGNYTFYAIFNKLGQDLTKRAQTQRSNIAVLPLSIK